MYIELVVGDPSHDGHGLTRSIIIDSNLSEKDLNRAYILGSNKLSFDLIEDVASNYRDNIISRDFFLKMISLGYEKLHLDSQNDFDYLDSDLFFDMFLFIVKLGDPSFVYNIVEIPNINIGGYGLFK